MPEGQFLTYQPGKLPVLAPDDLGWTLEKGSYLVLQLHMNTTGKPETLQASAGFYFSNRKPVNPPFKVALTSYTIDIPAGEPRYVVTDSFVLPVDVHVTAVLPHAHYLATETRGFASLPAGGIVPLIDIPRWDINWQGDYRYAKPVFLPKGSTLKMEFLYDNSTNNIRNPANPPRRVTFGGEASDEMAELWLQLRTGNSRDRALLSREYALKNERVYLERSQYLLRQDPNDPKGHFTMGVILLNQRKTAEGLKHLGLAVAAKPDYAEAFFTLGVVHLANGNLAQAQNAFESVIRIDPTDYRAHGSLGNVFLGKGRVTEAAAQFEKALQLNPNDATARENLDMIRRTRTGSPKPAP
jgi:hypothetical protein